MPISRSYDQDQTVSQPGGAVMEEHEVFPLIEATIPETELQTLGDRIRDAEH